MKLKFQASPTLSTGDPQNNLIRGYTAETETFKLARTEDFQIIRLASGSEGSPALISNYASWRTLFEINMNNLEQFRTA